MDDRKPPSDGETFRAVSGPNPTTIALIVIGALVVIGVIVAWAIVVRRSGDSPAVTGATLGGTSVTAVAPGVNSTAADGKPFSLPSPQVTPTPIVVAQTPRFPFGSTSPAPSPTPTAITTPMPTIPPASAITPTPFIPRQQAQQTGQGGGSTAAPQATDHSSRMAFHGSAGDVPALDGSGESTSDNPDGVNAHRATQGEQHSAQFVSTQGGSAQAQAPDTNNPQNVHQTRFIEQQESRGVGYVRPSSPAQLNATTVITVRLRSKIVSDLPGPFLFVVTQPLLDSRTHSIIVIPAGSMGFGLYDNALAGGQNRLLASGAIFVFPDGREFSIGGQPFTDAQGAAGIVGDTDEHRGRTYTEAFVLAGLGAAEAAIAPQTTSSLAAPSVGAQAQTAAGQQLTNVGNQLLAKGLNRQPTIIARPPAVIQMILTRDLPLEPYNGVLPTPVPNP